jgi:hypothetical protein
VVQGSPSGNEQRRSGRLARLQIAVRGGRVTQRVALADVDLDGPAADDLEQPRRGGDQLVARGLLM